jgi:SAM-dependent methyltransferase
MKPLYEGLVRCDDCSFVAAAADLDEEKLRCLYGEAYFFGDEYVDYLGDRRVFERNFRRRLTLVRRYQPDGLLIEVGSAYGFFLHMAQQHFRVLGYEISEDAARYARQVLEVPSKCADFVEDDGVGPGDADVVVMWDVLEHVAQPDRFIQKAADVLRVGGYLFLTTGDIDAWLPRRQGARWRLIHPPTHLNYFSRNTLQRLLESKGFRVLEVSYPGYFRSLHQTLYSLLALGRKRPPSLYRVLLSFLPKKLPIFLNTFDIMCVGALREGTSSGKAVNMLPASVQKQPRGSG